MLTSPTLRKLSPYKVMTQKVADYARYLQAKQPRKDPEELPGTDPNTKTLLWFEGSSTASIQSVSGTRRTQKSLTNTLHKGRNLQEKLNFEENTLSDVNMH